MSQRQIARFTVNGKAYAVRGNRLLRWSFKGYTDPMPRKSIDRTLLITPPLFVTILANGFQPRWHESAARLASV